MATKVSERPPRLTFSQFKQARLAAACKHAWIINWSTHGASALRAIFTATMDSKPLVDVIPEVANMCLYLALLSLPVIAAATARLHWVQPATIASHLLRSLVMCGSALGLFPLSEALRVILQSRIELPTEIAVSYRDQMSVPIMAVLHGIRQSGCAYILVHHMDVDPYNAVLRCILNWTVLVMVAAGFEYRTRSVWAKYQLKQQQEQQQEQLGFLLEAVPEFVSYLPTPDKSPTRGNSSLCDATDVSDSSSCPGTGGTNTSLSQPEQATSKGLLGVAMGHSVLAGVADPLDASPDCPPCALDMHASLASLAGWSGCQQPSWTSVLSVDKAFPGLAEEFPPEAAAQQEEDEGVRKDSAASLHRANARTDVCVCEEPAGAAGSSFTGPVNAMPLLSSCPEAVGTTLDSYGLQDSPPCFPLSSEIVAELALASGRKQPELVAVAAATRTHQHLLNMPQFHAAGERAGEPSQAGRNRLGTLAARTGKAGVQPSPSMLFQSIEQQRTTHYRRNRGSKPSTVHVKVKGIELEHLPPDLPKLMHEQLRHCMPGVTMTGLALRSGCVMMTMDLLSLLRGSETYNLCGGMASLLNWLMQNHAMGQVLEDRATMTIQTPGELALSQWDKDAGRYAPEGAQALDLQGLAWCHMLSVQPAVLCLPEARPQAVNEPKKAQQVTLIVQLQLPSNCLLHGWQPAGVTAPAGSGEYLQSLSEEAGPVVDAKLLARRLGGGYLPVMVDRMQRRSLGSKVATQHATTQVVVTLDGEAPAALILELWCKTQSPHPPAAGTDANLEVLVSQIPMIILPSRQKEAVAELQQHIESLRCTHAPLLTTQMASDSSAGFAATHPPVVGATKRGVSDSVSSLTSPLQAAAVDLMPVSSPGQEAAQTLIEDLGHFVTHCSPVAASSHLGTPAAGQDNEVTQLGGDLLVYAVQQGLGAVAGMIVDTMHRAEKQVPAMLRAARDSEETSVLHAAMASGNSDILAQVLSWGTKYGGPDWAWPWELEDATGCTALHLAAAQPTIGALLKTITCMLPAAQVEAACDAWLNGQGGVGVRPVELAVIAPHGGDVGGMWRGPASQLANTTGTDAPSQLTDSAGTGAPAQLTTITDTDSPSAAAVTSSHPTLTTTPDNPPSPPGDHKQTWLGSVVEVWTTVATDEYRAWAKTQMRSLVQFFAALVIIMAVVCFYRSYRNNCLRDELLHLCLHVAGYLPILASTSGITWVGDWQVWMLLVHVLDTGSYMAKVYMPIRAHFTWVVAAQGGIGMFYYVLLVATMDQVRLPARLCTTCLQTPLPQLLVVWTIVACLRGVAYIAAGISHPVLRTVSILVCTLVVSTLRHARQLRAFRQYQATKESSHDTAATHASKAKTE